MMKINDTPIKVEKKVKIILDLSGIKTKIS